MVYGVRNPPPAWAKIDPNHPLTGGLVFAWCEGMMADAAGGRPIVSVGSNGLMTFRGDIELEITRGATGLVHSSFSQRPGTTVSDGGLTWRVAAAPRSGYRFRLLNNTGSEVLDTAIFNDAGTFTPNTGGPAAADMAAGTQYVHGFTFNGSNRQIRNFFNGRPLASTPTMSGTIGIPPTIPDLELGSQQRYSTGPPGHRAGAAYLWRRVLSDAEIAWFSSAPYSIWQW